MHIPDGYLSPSTCAALYAGAVPFWLVALRRVQGMLGTRLVPLLSLFAAFSFVIMMFNLPLPGGTTGHAVGMAVTAIVLGPWASLLAISVALLIQAIFFGDGGVTAFGANCFNMAIAGSFAAFYLYRLIAGRAPLTAPRRVIAAGIAGYLAVNISALLTAVEFGIQPELFHTAAGAPLYAPYPLRIAVPVMLIGHLSFAGLAEMILSAGVVAYLQRADISLLGRTARAAAAAPGTSTPMPAGGWPAMRILWIGVAVLMIATPLGLLAAGSAWGEWNAKDFEDPARRQEIAAVSGDTAPPEHPPQGLKRLSAIWTAPMPGYAPAFLKSEATGYVLSAILGCGCVISGCFFIGWMVRVSGDVKVPDA